MYQTEIRAFGEFERHTFFSKDRKNQFSIVPAYGLNLLELQLNGQSLLDAYSDAAELKIGKWYKNTLLFPFPNRLKGGCYTHNGVDYQFPINEPSTQTALHGFGNTAAFEVTQVIPGTEAIEVHCLHQDPGERTYYPFSFNVEVRMHLSTAHGFRMDLSFQNTGSQSLPVGLGWHPYFAFNENIGQLKLRLPPCQKIEVDEQMISTGNITSFESFSQLAKIADTSLDNCFKLLPDTTDIAEAIIESSNGRLRYWQESGTDHFPFLQVFTPPNRESIALEPMSCNIDGFNNQDGLTVLAAGEELKGAFGVEWQAKE